MVMAWMISPASRIARSRGCGEHRTYDTHRRMFGERRGVMLSTDRYKYTSLYLLRLFKVNGIDESRVSMLTLNRTGITPIV